MISGVPGAIRTRGLPLRRTIEHLSSVFTYVQESRYPSGFFVFRVAPCSSKFTGVVRCSPVHFSSFLDFSKKGNKNIFHLPPILALFRAKTHLQSNRKPEQNISHLPEKYSLGKMIKKEYCILGSNEIRVYNTLYVSGGPVIRPLF